MSKTKKDDLHRDDIGIEEAIKKLNVEKDDVILYLGGRIDDDNLYPFDYINYLNHKIKELNPKKILCHSHWYAWKYYQTGILDQSTIIDMIFCHFNYLNREQFEPIDPAYYGKGTHIKYIEDMIARNPNLIFAGYKTNNKRGGADSVKFKESWFTPDYYFDNLIYFDLDRRYCPPDFNETRHGDHERNSTDGFCIISNFLELGFKNLNILGFTAFGSDEDDSRFSKYKSGEVAGHKYFNLPTSEDQKAEADILKSLVEDKKIQNLEICEETKEDEGHYKVELEYNGQALADKFVAHCTNFKEDGYFLELGSRHPKENNNSYVLEKVLGWKGIMVEKENTYREDYKTQRPNIIAIIEDATQIDYRKLFEENNVPHELGFLQIDLETKDNSTLKTLLKIDAEILDDYKFAVITMEHDVYTGLSNSVKTRYESRKILEGRGYYCVFKDILDTPSVCANSPYEDWWVHPDLVDMDYIRYLQDKNQEKTSTLGVETKIMVDSFKSYEVEY